MESIVNELLPSAARESSDPDTDIPAVDARGLVKRFGALLAVDHLDLVIAPGEFFGLLGPNGSGKTSTIHMLSTLIAPSAGSARVAGSDVARQPVAVRRAIGLVFQDSALDRSLTVQENLEFTAALHDVPTRVARPRIDELLQLFGLEDKRRARVANLSGGMRRALDIVRGVLHRPQVLFLDEPTIGLDIINRRSIWQYLQRLRTQEGLTILLTTHYLEEAAPCDRVAFLARGQLIGAGRPDDLIAALGYHILEVEGELDALAVELTPRLGAPLVTGEQLAYRVEDPHFSLSDIERQFAGRLKALRVRRPDLNDVYLWLNTQRPMDN